MLFLIKLFLDLGCGVLFSWGGYNFIQARRFIMPFVLGLGISILLHIWWLGFLVLPVMGTLCLGYPKFIKNQFWARGLWLVLQTFVIGLGLFVTGHLAWYFYIPYVLIAGVLSGLLYNLEQIVGDAYFGCWLGMIIFLVH